jgi:hypothetical protein
MSKYTGLLGPGGFNTPPPRLRVRSLMGMLLQATLFHFDTRLVDKCLVYFRGAAAVGLTQLACFSTMATEAKRSPGVNDFKEGQCQRA